jgi:hypothetical protein
MQFELRFIYFIFNPCIGSMALICFYLAIFDMMLQETRLIPQSAKKPQPCSLHVLLLNGVIPDHNPLTSGLNWTHVGT